MKPVLVSALLLSALVATPVLAQTVRGAAGPADPVALTPDTSISMTQAIAAAQAAVDACAKLPKNPPIVVSVFDLNGNAKVQLAADGYNNGGFEYARKKAYTVLKSGISSGEFGKLPDVAATGRGAAIRGDVNLIQYAGALPITRGGKVIGTISVSGPTGQVDDETCARAGLALIK